MMHAIQEENTDEPGEKMQCHYMPFGKNLISHQQQIIDRFLA